MIGTTLTNCTDDPSRAPATLTIAVDRTSVAKVDSWSEEAGAWASTIVEEGMADGFERLVILGIGPSSADAVTIADVDLRLECGGRRCDEDRQLLLAGVARAVEEIAAAPLAESGTDLVAALSAGADLCGTSPCQVAALTDGLDERLFKKEVGPDDVDEAAALLAGDLGDLGSARVRIVGVGANPEGDIEAGTLAAIWKQALKQSGAADVSVARTV